ncbi:peptidylprolyl isomerase [Geotalea sp. SG265]|uniref:peptidylprolyl isomerase n=1 Tax=Geotalea sp. SG265 TaxID=2922867 RepID=UPI001FAFFE4E|nr:peptidylprolyl isomerase [Geotalea sp. SG265]
MKKIIQSMAVVSGLVMAVATSAIAADAKTEDVKPSAVTGTEAANGKPNEAEESQIAVKFPIFAASFDKTPLAAVNDEPILLEELKAALAGLHQQQASEGKSGIKKDYMKVLNRLINTRLILAEATNMGIEETPEVKTAIDAYKMDHLRDMLKMKQLKDLKPDSKLVEQFYKDAVKEWKIRSVKLDKKEDAETLVKQIAAGGKFDELADKLIDGKKAEGIKEGQYIQPKALLPYVANAVSMMKVGSVSPVIPVGPAFTVIKLEDVRYPAGDVQAKEAAEKKALEIKQTEILTKYNKDLAKKYATVNEKLLKQLNFEAAKPGFKVLAKDKRVVVKMKGGEAITVADLADALAGRFYHGIDEAIKQKEVNSVKRVALDNLIYRVAFITEAKSQGIDQSAEYKHDVNEYRNSIVFGQFISTVVAPDVKVSDDDIAAYYKEHLNDYTIPAMVKAQGLVFQKKNAAEENMEKLKKGIDFDWVKNNAEGQVDKAQSEHLLEFSGKLLSIATMPDGIRETVQDAKEDDVRMYASPEGYFYVLQVKKVVPATHSPLEKERKRIFNEMFASKLNKTVDQWSEKLKKAYPVKIYLTGN